jgi:hypothetical protein
VIITSTPVFPHRQERGDAADGDVLRFDAKLELKVSDVSKLRKFVDADPKTLGRDQVSDFIHLFLP